jgi:hypothetical protein
MLELVVVFSSEKKWKRLEQLVGGNLAWKIG